MCDVHLIEMGRTRRNLLPYPCCYCGYEIKGAGIYVWGRLDNGSPGVHGFAYHDDCVNLVMYDTDDIEENDGCFSYGTPVETVVDTGNWTQA